MSSKYIINFKTGNEKAKVHEVCLATALARVGFFDVDIATLGDYHCKLL